MMKYTCYLCKCVKNVVNGFTRQVCFSIFKFVITAKKIPGFIIPFKLLFQLCLMTYFYEVLSWNCSGYSANVQLNKWRYISSLVSTKYGGYLNDRTSDCLFEYIFNTVSLLLKCVFLNCLEP